MTPLEKDERVCQDLKFKEKKSDKQILSPWDKGRWKEAIKNPRQAAHLPEWGRGGSLPWGADLLGIRRQ